MLINVKKYYMNEYQRFENVIIYLIRTKKVRNQQQFVEEIHSDKATVSQIKNGKLKIPNKMFASIAIAYPYISTHWIKTGDGEMVKQDIDQSDVGVDAIQIPDADTNIMAMNKLIDYIRFKDAAGQEQIQKFYEHLNKGQELLEKNMSNSHDQLSESQKHITSSHELLKDYIDKSHEQVSASQKHITSNQELLKNYMYQNKEQIDRLIAVIEKMNDIQYVPKKNARPCFAQL